VDWDLWIDEPVADRDLDKIYNLAAKLREEESEE